MSERPVRRGWNDQPPESLRRSGLIQRLEQLLPKEQERVALSLAAAVAPLHKLGSEAVSPPLGVVDALAALTELSSCDPVGLQAVDEVRHRLWRTPALGWDEEPDGLDFFALEAVVAAIYAADSVCTAPRDGLMNVCSVVEDTLGFASKDAEDWGAARLLPRAVLDLLDGQDDGLRLLTNEVEKLVMTLQNRE